MKREITLLAYPRSCDVPLPSSASSSSADAPASAASAASTSEVPPRLPFRATPPHDRRPSTRPAVDTL